MIASLDVGGLSERQGRVRFSADVTMHAHCSEALASYGVLAATVQVPPCIQEHAHNMHCIRKKKCKQATHLAQATIVRSVAHA